MTKITRKMVTEITEDLCNKGIVDWDDAATAHEVVGYALETFEKNREEEKVYGATPSEGVGEYGDEYPIIGYYTGKPHDIEAYIGCECDVYELPITDVPSGYAAHKSNVVAKRDRLLAEAAELAKRINERTVK